MTEYQIEPITRRCSVTGRELQSGERFYTALLEEGATFTRLDFSPEAWQGPPVAAFSFWTGKVPPPEASVKPRFDDDLLFDCFQRLEGQTETGRVNFRYVVALLLMRRKRLKFDRALVEDGEEKLSLRCVRTGTIYAVVNPRLTDDAMAQVQEEVLRVLGWN